MDFKGKVCLVTGASSGIGAATALELGRRGADLAITGRNAEALASVAEECSPAAVLQLVGSLEEEGFTERLVRETVQRYGRLDVLVNNAGVASSDSILDISTEALGKVLEVNLIAVIKLINGSAPHLILTKGNIVNVSSIVGFRSFPGILSYSLSKAALEQLTKCVALELAKDGVRVNTVSPGAVRSRILRGMEMSDKDYEAYLDRSRKAHPLGRVGKPEDVAAAIAFLASPAASFITGVSLPIDGGRHIVTPVTIK